MSNGALMAVDEIYAAGQKDAAKTQEIVAAVAEEARALGIIQTLDYQNKHNKLLRYAVLWRVKQSKSYKRRGMTWDEFCREVGESTRTVDRILDDMRPIYQDFSDKVANLTEVPFNKIRYLGRQLSDNLTDMDIDGEDIVCGDIRIPLLPESREDIIGLLDTIKEEQEKKDEQRAEEIEKMADKVKKLERNKNQMVKEKTKGLETERDALVKKVQSLEAMIPTDGDYSEYSVKKIESLEKILDTFVADAATIVVADGFLKDPVAVGRISGIIESMLIVIEGIQKKLDQVRTDAEEIASTEVYYAPETDNNDDA